MLLEVFLYMLNEIRKRVELLGGIDLQKIMQVDTKDQQHLSLQVLSLLNYVYQELIKFAQDPSKGGVENLENIEERKGAPGIIEESKDNSINMLQENAEAGAPQISEDGMSRVQREQIFPYLLDLLFENLINTLQDLTYEEIIFDYWDYKMDIQQKEPIQELFGPSDGESYLKKVCKYIKMYFRSQAADAPHEF